MARLLFYDDVPVFGGHEVMILNALEYLAQISRYRILFIYSSRNTLLEERLKDLAARYSCLVLASQPYATGRLQFLRTSWAIRPLRHLRAVIRNFAPDCMIVVQGDISNSSLGVLAGVREKVITVSYIPLAHSRQQRNEARFAPLKDAVLSRHYRLADRFITISDSVKSMLRERGVTQPIDVVSNGIDPSALRTVEKSDARTQLGLPLKTYIAALCGRIEFQQKGQDVLLHALDKAAQEFSDWTFLIAGDGPDRAKLKAMIDRSKLRYNIVYLPWQRDMALVYSAADMIVLPSRFEGLPVTMLEAMYYRLPIVASACDSMAELLPREWLFTPKDSAALAEAMLRVRSSSNEHWLRSHQQLVVAQFSIDQQKQEFARLIDQYLNDAAGPAR